MLTCKDLSIAFDAGMHACTHIYRPRPIYARKFGCSEWPATVKKLFEDNQRVCSAAGPYVITWRRSSNFLSVLYNFSRDVEKCRLQPVINRLNNDRACDFEVAIKLSECILSFSSMLALVECKIMVYSRPVYGDPTRDASRVYI
jgi:hypothetical protein